MFTLNRLQLLHCAYFLLILVSCEEFWRDFYVTQNFMQTWINSFSNPINLSLLPFAAIIGVLYAKEMEL
jgi:hypothetical protein